MYCFIADRRPRRVTQIGAGVATAVMLRAAKDVNYSPEIVCIDPFPTEYLKRMAERGSIVLLKQKAEKWPLRG